MKDVNTKSVLGYMVMPRIIPRFKRLFASGFGHLAFLLAQIYAMVRLLPPDHEYLNPQNHGTYGVHNVVIAAADRLVVSKQNIDQILIFSVILLGIVLLITQIILLAYSVLVNPALAQISPPANMFDTPSPPGGGFLKDIAFILLMKIFGVPEVFCNAEGLCTGISVKPFHLALHKLLQFYSTGILLIGMIIFLYYVLVVVFETAATGSPFGQRFQNGWVPIRLVVALGLLIPITQYGLNSGQYITLYAAKYGSGLATNAWNLFNNTIGKENGPTGEKESLMAVPAAPDLTPVIQAMSMVHACAYSYWHTDADPTSRDLPPHDSFYVKPYMVKAPQSWITNTSERMLLTHDTAYTTALDFFGNADIAISFGRQSSNYTDQLGQVDPVCGVVRIPINDLSHRGETGVGGAEAIQQFFFELIKDLWFGDEDYLYGMLSSGSTNNHTAQMSQRYMAIALREQGKTIFDVATGQTITKPMECWIGCDNTHLPSCTNVSTPSIVEDCYYQSPTTAARQHIINVFNQTFDTTVNNAWVTYSQNTQDFEMEDKVLAMGWGGAGSWYNKVNQINGAFMGAVTAMPMLVRFPGPMERVREIRREEDQNAGGIEQFNPNLSNGKSIGSDKMTGVDLARAKAMFNYFKWWVEDDANHARIDKQITGRAFEDVINAVFGTHNLMAMRGRNAHIHPMAQLTSLGKGLIDSAIMNVTASSGTALLAGLTTKQFSSTMGIVSEFLSTTAFLGLTAGFILYYILPFMPFLYFFFALGEWVKAIFEAMVGVPLWALAHIRITGEGLPGQSASSGYFLIFDIFLRPIMTVFGLIAAMVIFTGQVRILHLIWDLVVDNLSGYSGQGDAVIYDMFVFTIQRGVVDNFFFTVVYAAIVYMLATASFKLIDSIPDNMLRWMQGGVSTFGDMGGSHQSIEQIKQYAAISGISFGQQAVGATSQAMRGTGGALRGMASKIGGGT